jgi:DNA mismatch repair protein MSH4
MSKSRSVSFRLGVSSAASYDSAAVRSAATNSTRHNASTSIASGRSSFGGNYGASSILNGATSRSGVSTFKQTRLFQGGWPQDADDGTATADGSHRSASFSRRPSDTPSSRTTASRTRFTRLSAVRPTHPRHRLLRGGSKGPPPPRHVVCAISENLARETCVTSMDTHAPNSTLSASRQGNGQAYAETLACLCVLQPDEILLNEGRRTSQLVRKVLELYRQDPDQPVDWMMDNAPPNNAKRGSKRPRDRSSFYDSQGSANGTIDEGEHAHDSLASIPNGAAPLPGRDEGATRTVVKFVSRGLFDQTRGASMLRLLARHDTYDPTLLEEYILLSSAHAVISYAQMALGATFAPHSLQLLLSAGACDDGERFRSISNPRMIIDRTTQWQLELLVNSKTGKARPSLMATIDKTKTGVGSRLLRTNLMAPPTRIDTIEARLELVDTFLGSSDFFFEVDEHLEKLPDVDKMMSQITLVPQELGTGSREEQPSEQLVRLASKGIASLVSVKAVLSSIPHLAAALQNQLVVLEGESAANPSQRADDDGTAARSSLLVGLGTATPAATFADGGSGSGGSVAPTRNHLLRAVVSVLQQPQLASLLDLVTRIFTESTTYSRNAHSRQHQECFALKDECDNGLLTILRRSYMKNVDDIYKAADELAERSGLPVTVRYTASKGYRLSIPVTALATADLPLECLHPTKSGRTILFETLQVASLNGRAQDNVRDLLVVTHERIEEVLKQARDPGYCDALAALCDAIALLDLCHGFADLVSLSTLPWCRPMVYDDSSRENDAARAKSVRGSVGPAHHGDSFIIRSGRYPINVATVTNLEALEEGMASQYVPNDTFVGDQKTFTVITGVNGAGYEKAFALLSHGKHAHLSKLSHKSYRRILGKPHT